MLRKTFLMDHVFLKFHVYSLVFCKDTSKELNSRRQYEFYGRVRIRKLMRVNKSKTRSRSKSRRRN